MRRHFYTLYNYKEKKTERKKCPKLFQTKIKIPPNFPCFSLYQSLCINSCECVQMNLPVFQQRDLWKPVTT